ncbi:MAG: carboxypeptidase regulatory-like domain-containing protein [Gemmatimonadaceae bacterium]|nr:carboxypeptidase regulatory-like domain-containing protein [Gemmatimonadaceae bacterium]NUR33004.1 carboxypeptidase regulatory-like domain-containing protein [Gemmatimonadaceae bacterium]NUS31958.1 carboxypeptidase regulatory-like domain-containing protein [Gemmatimonadaceae bacterium]
MRLLRPLLVPVCPARSRVLRLLAGALLSGVVACEAVLVTPSRYGTLHVSVTMASGAPLADLGIVLYTGVRPMEYAATDESGQYTFERVPPGNYGVVGAMPAGLCDERGSTTMVKDNLDMPPGFDRVVTFTLHPCAAPAKDRF